MKSMHLPPQAYTKETLIQAYNWLRSQPAHVQELAKSPDALVALYSKAQIHGENYLSRTNLQTFKSELKNLAHMMGDLEDDPASKEPPTNDMPIKPPLGASIGTHNSFPAATNHPRNSSNMTAPAPSMPPPPPPLPSHVQGMMTQMVSEASSSLLPAVQSQAPPVVDIKSLLDARSLGMVQEIKNHLNLSNEAEALRMLIALGYQKIRPQF